MTVEAAIQTLIDNYKGDNNSFMYYLHEKGYFSEEKFWEFYESITVLVINDVNSSEITAQITHSYQRLLKYIIFHFDPKDDYALDNFPENYIDYLERIEYAIMAYFSGSVKLIDEEIFELKKPEQD
ncbi:MAG: hypothetical protein IJO70_08250 [Lachnospiraceae bacterium]|nr:hypothetical protein [Lachnospiraceae bacterium]